MKRMSLSRMLFVFGVLFFGFALLSAAENTIHKQKPKYIFLMIGDGMGVSQRAAAEMYKRISTASRPGEEKGMLFMNRFPVKGLTATQPYGKPVTDSAAAATALACGEKTSNGRIAISHDKKTKFKSIAYDAKEAGMKVGIISSVPLDHATPAAFFAQETSRGHYYEIASQVASSGFNYFAGQPFIGARKDKLKERIHPDEIAQKAGYSVFHEEKGMSEIKPGMDKIIWQANILFEMSRREGLSLVDLVRKGIDVLDNEKGFFMMIEGGKIDWAGHGNNIALNIKETLAFDDTVKLVYDFYKKHPEETLIVVTGDHECGGLTTAFSGGFSPERFIDAVNSQKALSSSFVHRCVNSLKHKEINEDEAVKQVCDTFGLKNMTSEEETELKKVLGYTLKYDTIDKRPEELKEMYGRKNMVVNACLTIIARRCGVTWTSFGHTGVAVATTAVGPYSQEFGGQTDNTDIANKLRGILR